MSNPSNSIKFRAQTDNSTDFDRYPREFDAARTLSTSMASRPLRILSFGCSTGKEAVSLRKWFPDASIIGLDTSPKAIEEAISLRSEGGAILYDLSSEETLSKYGPYDIIFVMSVLCNYPAARHTDDLSGSFSFGSFENLISIIDSHLKPGGGLVISNSNYEFLDTKVSERYDIVMDPSIKGVGYVGRFGPDSKKIPDYQGNAAVFRKMLPQDFPSSVRMFSIISANGEQLGKFSVAPFGSKLGRG